jgi:hypothetical protein
MHTRVGRARRTFARIGGERTFDHDERQHEGDECLRDALADKVVVASHHSSDISITTQWILDTAGGDSLRNIKGESNARSWCDRTRIRTWAVRRNHPLNRSPHTANHQ